MNMKFTGKLIDEMVEDTFGKELVKLLSKFGFTTYSRKGSHIKMINKERQAKTIMLSQIRFYLNRAKVAWCLKTKFLI